MDGQSSLGNGTPTQGFAFPSPRTASMAGAKRMRDDDDEGDDDDDGFDPDFEAPAYDDGAGDSDFNEPLPSSSQAPPQLPTPPKEETGGPSRPTKGRARTVSSQSQPERERKSIQIEYIQDKSRRHITFSKRKAGIMKKAYELSTLTGTQVLLLVVSETGMVYTFTTAKLQPIVNEDHGQRLIEACLAAEEGQLPAFAARDFEENANYEPTLNFRRSNGLRSPRRRQASSGAKVATASATEDTRRSSTRSSSAPKQHELPAPPQQQHPPATMPGPGPSSIPPPPTHHQLMPMPPPHHHVHHVHPMHAPPPQMPMQLQNSSADHLNALYEQMATSAAHTGGLQAMTIPPYFTDGSYRQDYPQGQPWPQ